MSSIPRRSAQCWVIKIGSSLLTAHGRGLDLHALRGWVAQMQTLRQKGLRILLVSSGAIAEGMSRLRLGRRPEALHQLQALAAIGQMGLIQAYESCFMESGTHTAQVLLTHEDIAHRERYLNARSTLRTLLDFGVVPVINENDTIATKEIRLGDNDTLAGLVANLVEADRLILLTDQAGLFTADPRHDPEARLIGEGRAGDPALERLAGEGSALGRGGMRTKLRSAELAARSGAETVIAAGLETDVLLRLHAGEAVGTRLLPVRPPIAARKQWLAGQLNVQGRLRVDEGAARVLREAGSSLLAVGVTAVSGRFQRGALVACLDPAGREIARGLVNYGNEEVERIKGQHTQRIAELLGYVDEPELIHRDNLVLTDTAS
ncbi:MAG: glutamate 5-kinase [Gammaproteobacteria bacterium]|nr:glutamate 5-kinase [Gammaproteobacteria bacterium]